MTDGELIEKARAFATKAHEGQKRWGGEPYITHPEAVAKAVQKELNCPRWAWVLPRSKAETVAIAWLHDVMEDCGVGIADLVEAGFPERMVNAVLLLTRFDGVGYKDYVLKIKRSGCWDAVMVKKADLRHNLSTCPPGKPVRDKWELALWILEN